MRTSGILLHISSLPSPYGIGTFGKEAYKFVDFLKGAGQRFWQILPLGPTSFGDSPYQSFSTFAGNPYFIDLDTLVNEGLLENGDLEKLSLCETPNKVDYETLYNERFPILEKAFSNFDINNKEFVEFKKQNEWLENYALFMALKKENDDIPWYEWPEALKLRKPAELEKATKRLDSEINFWSFLQFKFYSQWHKLKDYANKNDVHIIGDIPIYVAHDSADVWTNVQNFELDQKNNPINVAGCPPDGFSATGQLWGNPLYDWKYMKKNNYDWWIKRLKASADLYDVIRIDHFRGFESYYSIPYGEETALNGKWRKGPGISFFNAVKKQIGNLNIIAEDLGYLTQEVIDMRKQTGFPGMKIMEFAFDSREAGDYLPHNYDKNSVAYIGTHDNPTALGWLNTVNAEDKQYMMEYFDFDNDLGLVWKIIRKTFASVSDLVIIQMQDYLVLGDEARMNTPSTLGDNWTWRTDLGSFSDDLKYSILKITNLYQRNNSLLDEE